MACGPELAKSVDRRPSPTVTAWSDDASAAALVCSTCLRQVLRRGVGDATHKCVGVRAAAFHEGAAKVGRLVSRSTALDLRTNSRTVRRNVLPCRRLLGPPRLREMRAGAPSALKARRGRKTWRRPRPINVAAVSSVIRLSARSIMIRSRVNSRPLIWLTVIARHPKRLDDSLPSDISIGDGGDISRQGHRRQGQRGMSTPVCASPAPRDVASGHHRYPLASRAPRRGQTQPRGRVPCPE
jgi:hypothetical protein